MSKTGNAYISSTFRKIEEVGVSASLRAHNPKVGGSNPPPATIRKLRVQIENRGLFYFPLSTIPDKCG
jgi:hypothetical protein